MARGTLAVCDNFLPSVFVLVFVVVYTFFLSFSSFSSLARKKVAPAATLDSKCSSAHRAWSVATSEIVAPCVG